MPRLFNGKNAAVGYVATKFVLPLVKRRMKKKARNTAVNSAKGSARAVRGNPGKTSIAVGSVLGAVGYLVKRRRSRDTSDKD